MKREAYQAVALLKSSSRMSFPILARDWEPRLKIREGFAEKGAQAQFDHGVKSALSFSDREARLSQFRDGKIVRPRQEESG